MNLTDQERDDLAEVLSERLVGFPVRRATAEGAGLIETDVGGEPVQRWRLLIDRAAEKGKLIALLKSAQAHSPGDPVLDRLVEGAEQGALVLPDEEAPGPPWRVLAIGAIGAVLIVVMVVLGVRLVEALDAWVPAPKVAAPPGEVPEVEVRPGLMAVPKPAPAPAPVPRPPPVEPSDTGRPPAPPSDRFIRIPDPSETAPVPSHTTPAPEPAPAPSP